MASGIYKICSLIDDRVYVGSAVNFDSRKAIHFSTLKNQKHKNPKLQNFYNKYGKDCLKFDIIEHCDEEWLIVCEQYYIDTIKPTFNICEIAGSTLGIKFSDRGIKNLRDAHARIVYQFDLNGNLIKIWPSIREASEEYKCCRSGINKCCNKRFASYIGYIWSYNKAEFVEKYINPRSFPVYQYDENFKLVNTFESITDASEKTRYAENFLSKICSANKGTAFGFYFVKSPQTKEELMYNNGIRYIHVFDKSWNELYKHYNFLQISKKFDVQITSISRHLNSKKHKTFKGYYFRYEDEINDKTLQ